MFTGWFLNVNVDAVAKVRISPHADGIKLAAKNFLNKKPDEITGLVGLPLRLGLGDGDVPVRLGLGDGGVLFGGAAAGRG